MNTNKQNYELLIEGCDNRDRGAIYEGHDVIPTLKIAEAF